MIEIGAQLYTVREFCKTTDGFARSLERVAEIGYKNVQVSGTCPFEAQWLRDQLKRNGLRCVITHTPKDKLTGDIEQVIRDHDVFGCKYVGLGFWAFDPASNMTFDRFMEIYPAVARKLKAGGKYFMYHNHDGEFQRLDGKVILEKLSEAIPADEMGFTLDTFWVQAGGGDPAFWLEKLAGRTPCIHLKDFAYGRKMAVLGEGNINFDRVFAMAQKGGVETMLVEQDDCGGEDPFDCLARSYAYLKSHGFQ